MRFKSPADLVWNPALKIRGIRRIAGFADLALLSLISLVQNIYFYLTNVQVCVGKIKIKCRQLKVFRIK